MRIVFHIDVNNAFLSWTAVDLLKSGYKYDIRDSYAIIGGDPKKRSGVVLAKSNPAKKLGIKTGETLVSAMKKCRVLRSYPPNYELYENMSKAFTDIVKSYSPDVEVASIDECYLEYTNIHKLYGDPIEFAYKLQKEIYDKLGFTVNIGIGNNKLTSKMASDFSKPNKVHTCFDNEIETKLWPLSVNRLFGVGKKTSEKLNQLGINTIYDLAHADSYKLSKYFKNMSIDLINKANGIDNSVVEVEHELKGMGNEITLPNDVSNKKELERYLFNIADHLSFRLRKDEKYTNCISIVLKDNKFKKKSKQITIKNETNRTKDIYKCSINLLNDLYNGERIRLIGIRVSNLSTRTSYQTSLTESYEEIKTDEKLMNIVDDINKKYGKNIIKRSSINKKVGK